MNLGRWSKKTKISAEKKNISVSSISLTRFIDAYHKGLNGRQAAWAAKKY
ncbi:hypothetical protein EDB19DRAFT_1642570 [Suillus lakei]|nr:hypothetical protein EDB19DRAFT_1642570 [Suillus lakei]